jgi:hypothetical protein
MKYFILILMMLSFYTARSQKMERILTYFKAKNVDSVIKQCSFPFDLSAGSMIDDAGIKESSLLRKKIQRLFKENYFDHFLKGKRFADYVRNQISYEVKSFNKDGELESESTLSFVFKKTKEGKFKLVQIFLAG